MMGDPPRDEENKQSGRPSNDVEVGPRDERTNPVLSVYKTIASDFMSEIDKIVDPKYLKHMNVKNLRFLGANNKKELEKFKYMLLATSINYSHIPDNIIEMYMSANKNSFIKRFFEIHKCLCALFVERVGKNPNIKHRRSLAKSSWAILKLEVSRGD